jgi:hypothetical protein
MKNPVWLTQYACSLDLQSLNQSRIFLTVKKPQSGLTAIPPFTASQLRGTI